MRQQNRTIRIFVSSTFNDWHVERDALQDDVWPRLTEFCAGHGFQFQAVDLRWGVSKDAVQAAQTVEICLQEIQRCLQLSPKPNFLILLGDRYGSCILPESIRDDEFQSICSVLSDEESEMLAGSSAHDGWYRRDDNAQFHGNEDTNVGSWRLQPWHDRVHSMDDWRQTESQLYEALKRGTQSIVGTCQIPLTSASHQEIQWVRDHADEPQEHVVACIRSVRGVPDDKSGQMYADRDPRAHNQQLELRESVRVGLGKWVRRVHEYDLDWSERSSKHYVQKFCEDVFSSLKTCIEERIAQFDAGEHSQERQAHEDLSTELLGGFVGREQEIQAVLDHLKRSNRRVFVLYGVSGTGKSALMAVTADKVRQLYPHAAVIEKYCGATPTSTNEQSFMSHLCLEISAIYDLDEPADNRNVLEFLQELMNTTPSADRPLVLFLDGLDQLDGTFPWMPESLPENVSVVCSCVAGQIPGALQKHECYELQPLLEPEAWLLIEGQLQSHGRTLQQEQQQCVRDKLARCGLPLYARLLCDPLLALKSFDRVPEWPSSPKGLIMDSFERMAQPERHGRELVQAALTYLFLARNGLGEIELSELLAQDDEVWDAVCRRAVHPPPNRRIPSSVLARLLFDLSPFLRDATIQNHSVMVFLHAQISEIVRDYINCTSLVLKQYHSRLAMYFSELKPRTSPRRLDESPWHFAAAEEWSQLTEFLSDDDYINAICVMNEWDERHQRVVSYWDKIESNSDIRVTEVFEQALQSYLPASFLNVFLAKLLHRTGHIDAATEFVDRMLHMCRELNNVSDRLEYLHVKAAILRDEGDHNGAMELLQEEESIVRKYHTSIDGVIAKVKEQGLPEDVEQEHIEAFKNYLDFDDGQGEITLAATLGNQALFCENANELDRALVLHRQAADIYRKHQDVDGLALSHFRQAAIVRQLGSAEDALTLAQESARCYRLGGQRNQLIDSLNLVAELQHELSDRSAAAETLEELASFLRTFGNSPELRITLGRLAETLFGQELGEGFDALAALVELRKLSCEAEDVETLGRCNKMLVAAVLPVMPEVDVSNISVNSIVSFIGMRVEWTYKAQRYEETEALLSASIELQKETDDLQRLTDYQGFHGSILQELGRLDLAERRFCEKQQGCSALGDLEGVRDCLRSRATIALYLQSDFDRAHQLLLEEEELNRRFGDKSALIENLGKQADARIGTGDLQAALKLLRQQEQLCRDQQDVHRLVSSLVNQATTMKELEEIEAAASILEASLQVATEHGLTEMVRKINRLKNNDVSSKIQSCPNCKVRVQPSQEGICPSCKRSICDEPENTEISATHGRVGEGSAPQKPWWKFW